jgi:hypothetical protein
VEVNKDFSEEVWCEDSGDFLRHLRTDDTDGRACSDDDHHEDVDECERAQAIGDGENGYLHEMLNDSVDGHVGNPTTKGLRYVVYSTGSEDMAEKLLSLLSRFVLPCSIVEVHSDCFYTFGCWLRSSEIKELEASLNLRKISYVDWDEEMRKLLTEDGGNEL